MCLGVSENRILRTNLSYTKFIDGDPETISLNAQLPLYQVTRYPQLVFSLKETRSIIHPFSTELHSSAADVYGLFDIAAMDQASQGDMSLIEPPRMSFYP
jgi:hypothetical protein